ncbi:amino acid ABC transporter permease [bacterium RCC_150]
MKTYSPSDSHRMSAPGDVESTKQLTTVALRHPFRWVAAATLGLIALWGLKILVTTEAFQWDVVGEYLFSQPVLTGVVQTIEITVLSMVVAIVLGVVIAVMRLSSNPVLYLLAGFYTWFFRGTPLLVQLIFWFNLSSVFPRIQIDLPGVLHVLNLNTNQVMSPFVSALLGLGLNQAAYYAEIVRAGILSVDEGQSEAALAYGLSRYQTMRYIVLPQAMRVIIPPTGNETIGMLKTTSLASVIAFAELLQSVTVIYNRTFQIIPLLIVAALWYLAITSVLSIIQGFVEKRFTRGARRNAPQSTLVNMIVGLRKAGLIRRAVQ